MTICLLTLGLTFRVTWRLLLSDNYCDVQRSARFSQGTIIRVYLSEIFSKDIRGME